ncbi:N-6 DNA methylase [Streptomyces sp. LaPpAH-108]|uniref:N-6 DNA methylase n=1 Tax=Streptomyces sp. LaPpAH-108 TaxID=1155714 RepID=UPI0003A3DBA4|nr:N-6 DNA methylase [Streptomyces sp. LaPpAH-108]
MVRESTVTAAEIARIADVGPAAVSNWRRRYPEFPTPVGGTAGSPQFLLSEVVNWLEEHGRSVRITPADGVWRAMEAMRDPGRPGAILAAVGFRLLGEELPHRLAGVVGGSAVLPSALGADIDDLGARYGAAEAFEALLHRWTEAHARHAEVTVPPVAQLMCALLAPADGEALATVLDPACGTGGLLLRAAERGATSLLGQDIDPDLAEVASIRLRLHGCPNVTVEPGDSLLRDTHSTTRVRGVVCNPPSGQQDWGRAELAYDTRWTYGLPPKGEPELAWLQHALAHLDPGGCAVLAMSPSVATRPSGRRIRAELVRRGVLRAVVALPSGSPRTPGIHLWVAEPAQESVQPGNILFVDAESLFVSNPEQPGSAVKWDAVHAEVTSLWHRFRAGEEPDTDFASSVPVTGLLGNDVDVTPARHVRIFLGTAIDPGSLAEERVEWLRSLNGLLDALPAVREPAASQTGAAEADASAVVSLDDLIRSGALRQWRGSAARGPTDKDLARVPLLSLDDGLSRAGPSGHTYVAETERIREADVLVFAAAPESARPAERREYGAAAGQGVTVLRPERAFLDPWFLAGAMSADTGIGRSLTSTGSTSRRTRLDTGRIFVPVRSPEEQRAIGRALQDIARFQESLTVAVDQGRHVARQLAHALAAGLVDPIDDRWR